MDHLEEEAARLLLARHRRPAAERGQRPADKARHDLVDERQPVALVVAKRNQRHGLVGIGRGLAVLVHGGVRGQRLALPLQLLHAAHRDHARRPVDHDRKPDRVTRGKTPGVRIRAERGEHAAKRHHLGQRRGAVGVGDVALLRGLHHIPTAPQVVEGVVDRHRARAVLVRQPHAGVDRLPGHGLAELLLGVPHLGRVEPRGKLFDRRLGHAPARLRPEEFVEVQCLDGIVGADAVPGGGRGQLRRVIGLDGIVSAVLVGRAHERFVRGDGDDEEGFRHGLCSSPFLGAWRGFFVRGRVFRRPSSRERWDSPAQAAARRSSPE